MALATTFLIGGIILVVVSVLSIWASIITLYIIHALDKWNGYMRVIWSLTICQIIYDVSFFFYVAFYIGENDICYEFSIFLSTFGGLAVTLWTNALIFVVLYMVCTLRSADMMRNYWKAFVLSVVFPIVFAVTTTVLVNYNKYWLVVEDEIYNSIRVTSIAINIVAYAYAACKLRHVAGASNTISGSEALQILSARLKYYPICQVVTRFYPTCYEFYFGFNNQGYAQPNGISGRASLYAYCFFLPSAGIGYLCVFLIMQPDAMSHFKRMIPSWLCCYLREFDEGALGRSSMSSITGLKTSLSANPSIGSCENQALLQLGDMDELQLEREIEHQFSKRTQSQDSRVRWASHEEGWNALDTL